MKSKIVFLIVLALLLPAMAGAHSTKGRLKVPLEKEMPIVDDFAYFIESYTHHHLYADADPKAAGRFYATDMQDVRHDGSRAVVFFDVLDTRTNETFLETMTFDRADNGEWEYRVSGGKSLSVYTYVDKNAWYFEKFRIPAAIAVLIAGVGFLVWRIMLRKQGPRKTYGSMAVGLPDDDTDATVTEA